ncbi:hypothetical protein V2G26_016987 [Clonostachys chloroleuca]
MGVQDSLSLGGRRAAALSLDANSNPQAHMSREPLRPASSPALDAPPALRRAKRSGWFQASTVLNAEPLVTEEAGPPGVSPASTRHLCTGTP